MGKRFSLEQVAVQSPEIYEIFKQHDDAIVEAMKKINNVLPKDFKINMDYFFEINQKSNTDYMNDGNTETKGFEWTAHWAFPINGHKKEDYDSGSINGQYCPEAIIFSLSNFYERCYDKRISGCKFFSLYFGFGDYSNIANLSERGNNSQIRLDYINNNYTPMSILKPENYTKIAIAMDKLMTAVNFYNLLS